MWPYISGQVAESPRTDIFGDVTMYISGDYKIMQGDNPDACWAGPQYPNGTDDPACKTTEHCGDSGCLYNIIEDPQERHNVASEQPEKLKEMQQKLAAAQKTFFNPTRGGGEADKAAQQGMRTAITQMITVFTAVKNGDFWGPFIFP